MESKALTRTKAHVKSKLKAGLLSQCSHHLIPGHNKNKPTTSNNINSEFDQFSTSELFQAFPYHCDLPKPLLPPAKVRRDCCREDSSMQLIHTKSKIQDDINRYLELYKKHSSTLDKHMKQNVAFTKDDNDSATISKYLFDTAKILEYDPDPTFSGNYNWYYSGGTLNGILYDTRNILVFPYSNELIALPIELREDSLFKPNYKDAAKIPIQENLYQIVCSTLNNNGRILARFKNDCVILNLFNLDKKKLNLLRIYNQPSETPYISADFDPINVNHYCSVNVDRYIKVWDLSKKKNVLLTKKVPSMRCVEDNWASVKYDDCNGNILKYTDRHCVYYYDSRSPEDRPDLKMCPKGYLEDCESLSYYIASCKSEYFSYVASNHNLCLIDSRFPETPVVKKWSHLFKRSPLYCDVLFRENHEFIVMASQVAGETAVILNDWKSTEEPPETFSMPFSPPSSMETLIALRSQGKCLDPYISNRLSLCNTGCMATIDQQSNDVFVLTQNSINDIFYQCISYQEQLDLYSLENCKALYKLKTWNRQILKNDYHEIVAPLVVTKRTSAREMLRTFTDQKLQTSTNTNEGNQELEYTPTWKRSLAELNSFVDILASELLLPWEVVEDAPAVPITAAPHQKVLSWLGMAENNQQEPVPVDANTEGPPAVARTQEPDIVQRLDIFEENHDSEFIQAFLPKVKTEVTQGNKKSKKKSQFVPGF